MYLVYDVIFGFIYLLYEIGREVLVSPESADRTENSATMALSSPHPANIQPQFFRFCME